ncbi:MAG: DNA-binding protein WhiA [Schwartzia sp.]|nr:DNA-binding protein WhiA [Schwartzia sp. (in: firmicutes)]
MISFASEVKNELARGEGDGECCRRAELAALLKTGATMTLGGRSGPGLSFSTENAAVARRVLRLLKDEGAITTEITVSRALRLKKNTRYEVRIPPQPAVGRMIEELELLPGSAPTPGRGFLKRSCCEVAYIRGAFLSAGSVNRPGAGYHLEFVSTSYQYAEFLLNLAEKLSLPARLTDRKEFYIVYVKEADAIADFLNMVGAEQAAEKLEISRNVKEVRNQVNRLVNCETANLQKTADAAARQLNAIRQLTGEGKAALPEKLQETLEARLANPDASLTDLAEILGITRSGVNHRLRKIVEMAENM